MIDYNKEVVTSTNEYPVEILKRGLRGKYSIIAIYKDSFATNVLKLDKDGNSLEGPSVKNKSIITKSFFNFYFEPNKVNYLIQHQDLKIAIESAGDFCRGQIEISYDFENKVMEVKKI